MELKCSDDLKKLFLDFAYPIGSVWMTRTKDDPNEIMGGTWEAIDGAYLYATNISQNCDTGYCGTGNKTRDHAITKEQMPDHEHWVYFSSINNQCSSEPLRNNGAPLDADEGNALVGNWCNGDKKWIGYTSHSGGNQGHSHTIPWIGVHFWYRTA